MPHALTRWLAASLCGLAGWVLPAHGATEIRLNANAPQALTRDFECGRVAGHAPADADALWRGRIGEPCQALATRAGMTTIGRLRLGPRAGAHVLEFPSTRTDLIVVRTRPPGGAWSRMQAGDLVALRDWPMSGQAPAFPLPAGGPLEVLVEIRNSGAGPVAALAWPAARHDRHRILQSNLSGIVGGLGLMCVVVCVISVVNHRTRSAWLGLAYACCTALTVFAFNGFGAIWLYPALPWLNDFLKAALPVATAALLFWSILREIDRLPPGAWRNASVALVLTAAWATIAWAALDVAAPWRRATVGGFAGLAVLASLALCVLSWLRGGRYALHLGAAALLFALASAMAFVPGSPWLALDLQSALAGTLLFASVLTIRQARLMRLRFGRDILGLEARAKLRDSLTGLLSYTGLHRAWDAARLRQRATPDEEVAVLLLALCAADRTGETLGYEANAELRMLIATALQSAFDDRWQLGRLGPGHFAAVASVPAGECEELADRASRILAACARADPAVDVVGQLDLRIAWQCGRAGPQGLEEVVRQLDTHARTLPAGKRIARLRRP
jgi:GGDEF domain-containing protein